MSGGRARQGADMMGGGAVHTWSRFQQFHSAEESPQPA